MIAGRFIWLWRFQPWFYFSCPMVLDRLYAAEIRVTWLRNYNYEWLSLTKEANLKNWRESLDRIAKPSDKSEIRRRKNMETNSPFTSFRDFFRAQTNVIGIKQKVLVVCWVSLYLRWYVLTSNIDTARWSNALSYVPARVNASMHLGKQIRDGKSICQPYAPERAQTESSLFASYSVVWFFDIVTINKVLWAIPQSGFRDKVYENFTFDVKPPRSGVLRICFNVVTKRGSDWKWLNTRFYLLKTVNVLSLVE